MISCLITLCNGSADTSAWFHLWSNCRIFLVHLLSYVMHLTGVLIVAEGSLMADFTVATGKQFAMDVGCREQYLPQSPSIAPKFTLPPNYDTSYRCWTFGDSENRDIQIFRSKPLLRTTGKSWVASKLVQFQRLFRGYVVNGASGIIGLDRDDGSVFVYVWLYMRHRSSGYSSGDTNSSWSLHYLLLCADSHDLED